MQKVQVFLCHRGLSHVRFKQQASISHCSTTVTNSDSVDGQNDLCCEDRGHNYQLFCQSRKAGAIFFNGVGFFLEGGGVALLPSIKLFIQAIIFFCF